MATNTGRQIRPGLQQPRRFYLKLLKVTLFIKRPKDRQPRVFS